jgi:hypothetical protein
MKTYQTQPNQITRCILQLMCVVAIAVAGSKPVRVQANANPVPPVPANLGVPAGNELFLAGHAIGTQQYMCLLTGSSYAWAFFTPQATLFKDGNKQIITHFLSPNPAEGGAARVTWQYATDSSAVWATPITSSTSSKFVAPGAIPWLLLKAGGVQAGPEGGDTLTRTTFIQRLNTTGGSAPASGCAVRADIGKKALAPYTADYFFYEAASDKGYANE